MTTKVMRIRETNNSATRDLADTLDSEYDAMWGLVAIIETLCREGGGDAYAKGALRIAHNDVDALSAIRQDLVAHSVLATGPSVPR